METPPLPTPGSENLTEQLNRSLQQQRDRVREFVASQRRRVDSVESQLGERIKTLLDHLDNDRRDADATSHQIEQQAEHITREKETLEQLRETLDERHRDWQTTQQQTQTQQEHLFDQAWRQGEELQERLRELLSREPEIQAAEQRLRDERHAFDLLRKEHETESARLEALREQLESQRVELESQQEQVAAAAADTEERRLRIAQALKKQRKEQLGEIHEQRQQLADRDNAQWEELKSRLDSTTGGDNEALSQDIKQKTEHLAREKEALQQLSETIDQRQSQWETMQQEAQARGEQTLEGLQQRREELENRVAELDSRSAELDSREASLADTRQKLSDEHHALELTQKEHEALRSQAEELKQQLQAEQAELQTQREELVATRSKTDSQRRQIARELRQQRVSQLAEIDRHREETVVGENRELQQLRAQLAEVSANSGSDEAVVNDLRSQLEAASRRETDMKAEVEELKSDLRNRPTTSGEGTPAGADDDLTRRYEMVLDDLKELKTANEELRQQLDEAQVGVARQTTTAAADGALDWEAEKQRMLQQWDDEGNEGGEEDEQRAAGRLEVDGVIQMTDKALAGKDREIADLKLLLENQSDNIGSVAVGAAALGGMLDADPVIAEERENLKRIQEEWQKKLSQAEIEISTERATLARDKIEIEEKMRLLEAASASHPAEQQNAEGADQPGQNRWLTRLGLANDSSDENQPK